VALPLSDLRPRVRNCRWHTGHRCSEPVSTPPPQPARTIRVILPGRSAFGDRVRAQRQELGLSRDLSRTKAAIDRTFIATLEAGRRNPSLDLMARLAAALDADLGELVGGLQAKGGAGDVRRFCPISVRHGCRQSDLRHVTRHWLRLQVKTEVSRRCPSRPVHRRPPRQNKLSVMHTRRH
jgi:transcriptional regulator with XRE-family HTH domain